MQSETQMAMSAFATQLGSISAFFGGVAATLLALVIFSRLRSRLVEVATGTFVAAAVCFIVSALAATILSVGLLPGASRDLATPAYLRGVVGIMNIAFLTGIVALLGGIAVLGWLRSRTSGIVTTSLAVPGLLAVLWLSIRVS